MSCVVVQSLTVGFAHVAMHAVLNTHPPASHCSTTIPTVPTTHAAQVRRRPYSVLLFDEVEKAHAEVFNVLLSVLDDGRLTDGKGRTIDFSNTLIIMTSNLGSEHLLAAAAATSAPGSPREQVVNGLAGGGQQPAAPPSGVCPALAAAAREAVMGAVKRHFRPEFINRLDDIVVFEPLSRQQLLGVARLLSAELDGRLAPRNISLKLTDAALAHAVAAAYDPAFGARPLRRWLEHVVITDLSRMIVSGELPDSSDVTADHVTGQSGLSYTVVPKPVPQAGTAAPGSAAAAVSVLKRTLADSSALDNDDDDDDDDDDGGDDDVMEL
jgi:ATP-dependent Clp protease ATP-binding subunit ClpB